MQYSEQDTERVRQAEQQTAVGTETQRLNLPYQPAQYQAVDTQQSYISNIDDSRKQKLAIGLIAAGAIFFLLRTFSLELELTGGLVLFTISSCFFFFGLWQRIYGLIIPACILAGLSIGVTFADLTNGVSVLWGLALGFLGILALGRSLFNMQSPWPIFPAIPLFAVGAIVAIANLGSFFALGMLWLPLLLIGAGLYLGWGSKRTA